MERLIAILREIEAEIPGPLAVVIKADDGTLIEVTGAHFDGEHVVLEI